MNGTGGQPLSIRLALLLSVAVVAVLLVTGFAVNRVVSQGIEDELGQVQRDRLAFVAQQLEGVDLEQPRTRALVHRALQAIARQSGGRIVLADGEGQSLISAGDLPDGTAVRRVSEEIPNSDGMTLAYEAPSSSSAFLRVFNLTLLVAGTLAVGALILAAALLSDRLTRPLRGVSAAAGRLGAGDLGARADGGPDRESRELAAAFNAMAERLQRSEELRRRAASDVAHDLATPATVLESQLQAMVDGVVPADRAELTRAQAAAGAMSAVIAQLRELIDVEAAAIQRRAQPTDLSALVEEQRQAMEPYSRERGVMLELEATHDPVTVEADPGQLGRAMRNVLTNALQHSQEGGRVRLALAAEGGDVVFRVDDQGLGIAAEDLPHIFERFYRADPSRSPSGASGGGGIGLTIARELVTANGGSIEVERTGPEGTTFAIRLPRFA